MSTAPVMPEPHCKSTRTVDELVSESLPAVRFLAGRLAARTPRDVELDDLVQAGVIGLLQSADRFDPRRGVKFQTYASRRVQGAMLDYLRSLDWKPRSVRSKSRMLEYAFHTAAQRLGGRATHEDAAEEIGITVQQMEDWLGAAAAVSWGEAEREPNSVFALEALPDPADSPEQALAKEQMKQVLSQAIERLPPKERLVLTLYYYEQLTMQEIGTVLGVRQARISQLHSQAVARLRNRVRRLMGQRGLAPIPSRSLVCNSAARRRTA